MKLKWIVCVCALLAVFPAWSEKIPVELEGVGIDPKLGARLDGSLKFRDESGREVALGSFFDGRRPVVLVLAYYGCPMLCGVLLNGVRDSLQNLEWKLGPQYRIVTVSIDPQEQFTLAKNKKNSVLESLNREDFRAAAATDWHFLTGPKESSERLAQQIGFRYKWDKNRKEWAHGAAIFFISPDGVLTRALFGLAFDAKSLRLALLEASRGKVGTLAEKFLLFCYHYDPKGRKYALVASRVMQLAGGLTVLIVAAAYLLWFLPSKRKGDL
ncbi:MAG: SCO family protein [Bdellovibrionales bacterium]|nr:SCO family protein [Bdellovibrionales bacterium]